MKLLHLLLDLRLFAYYLLMLTIMISLYIKWMWKVHSSMVSLRKKYMLLNPQVLKIQRILTKSSDSTRPSMASSRPLGRGMILWRNSSWRKASNPVHLTQLFSLNLMMVNCLCAKYMLMILSLAVLTNVIVMNLPIWWVKNIKCLWWESWNSS